MYVGPYRQGGSTLLQKGPYPDKDKWGVTGRPRGNWGVWGRPPGNFKKIRHFRDIQGGGGGGYRHPKKKTLDTALTNHSLHVKKKMLQNNRSRGPICPNCVANSGSATVLNQGRSWLNQGNRIRFIFSWFHELFPA